MKTTAMCFSLLQLPRCGFHSLANSWFESFHKIGRGSRGSSTYRILCANNLDPEGGYSRRWTRRNTHSKAEASNRGSVRKGGEPDCIKLEAAKVQKTRKVGVRKKPISENTENKLNTFRVGLKEAEPDQDFNELAKLATIICFDIETTGFLSPNNRIIEIAFHDLRGGENSTFQTLVNPECEVKNNFVHGISTNMVNSDGVPRMKEAIPIIMQYVKSRQLPGGLVVMVSHNGRIFDVPFLKNEFRRCNYEIPEDWVFADTVPLARTVLKAKGIKEYTRVSLGTLREHYGIPLIGSAHRALSDCHSLALVLQRLTYDLKMTVAGLIQESFK